MNAATLMGSGKVKEVRDTAVDRTAGTVVILNRLKATQHSRLEAATGCRVVSANWSQ
jgi:50S ribosomal subunit-associated GTPase HflX